MIRLIVVGFAGFIAGSFSTIIILAMCAVGKGESDDQG